MGCGVEGGGRDSLLEEGGADVAERDALGVADDGAPWGVLGDDDELLDARHRRGLVLGREGDVAVTRFMVVPARLACDTASGRLIEGGVHGMRRERRIGTYLWIG